MMVKVCKKCNLEKDILDFYTHKQMKDGYLNICKKCTIERIHKEYIGDIDEGLTC